MQIEMMPVSKLTLLKDNPRTISKDAMEKLCKSIQDDPEFLKCRPLLVNKTCIWDELKAESNENVKRHDTYTVYAGNQRLRAAKKLKMKEVPCIVGFDLCPELMKKRIIIDNTTFGKFDFDILANNFDIEMLIDCGFKAEEILGDLSNISDDDRVNKKKKKCNECPHCGGKI